MEAVGTRLTLALGPVTADDVEAVLRFRSEGMVLDDNVDAHEFWATRGYRVQPEWSSWVEPLGE